MQDSYGVRIRSVNAGWQTIFSSLGAAGLRGAAVWLGRSLILTRLQKSVEHEFTRKLENLKSDLRSKEAEIAAIRETAAAAVTDRGRAVESRRLQAIDDLWEGFQEAKKRSWPLHTIGFLKLDAMGKRIKEEGVQKYLMTLYPKTEEAIQDWTFAKANTSRPWVSDVACAYSAMVAFSHTWILTAKMGLNPQEFVSQKQVNKLLALAIPEFKLNEDEDNSGLFASAAMYLEDKLITELKEDIRGKRASEAAIRNAKEIVDAAGAVQSDIKAAHERSAESTEKGTANSEA